VRADTAADALASEMKVTFDAEELDTFFGGFAPMDSADELCAFACDA
jgi:hypothetical protein